MPGLRATWDIPPVRSLRLLPILLSGSPARELSMVNDPLHWILLTPSLVTVLSVFIALFFISAPYGRYARRGWGPQIPTWLGWLLMESVSAVLMLVMFIVGE